MTTPQTSHHQLLGSQVSLYTGKVRAYLRYKRLPFEEVLSTQEVYRDVILPRTGVRYIPVLVTDDDVAVQDSTEIIDTLEERYPESAVYPATPVQNLVARLFELYGDEWLVIPAMHYRWNVPLNRQFAIAEFGRTSAPDAPPEEQWQIGERLSAPFAGALPYLGITPRTEQAIERSYLELLAELDAHFARHPYLLGTRPSIGDYGLLGPLYAHLWRDPESGVLMQRIAPWLAAWVQRMQYPAGAAGEFLPDDQVPSTLLPPLARMFREQVPVLLRTAERLEAWASEHDGVDLPRSIGKLEFELEGATEQRAVNPYPLWMWQRVCDFHRGMAGAERARLARLFEALPGAIGALEKPLPRRVKRHRNRLQLDE